MTGETPFETEARAIDDARTPRTLADGGEITGGELLQVGTLEGCHACCHRAEPPANITVNVHGSVTSAEDVARIVTDQLKQWSRRNTSDGG